MERVQYEPLLVQDLINLEKHKELNTNPWYQRRSVWTNSQKSYLINTLFEQKPVPTIYIRHSLDFEKERSIKEIVDGQQRVSAILDYVNGKFSARHPKHDKPIYFQDLSRSEKKDFLMTSLSVGTLVGAEEKDVIDIFGRINSVSKVLNSQEKRNARYSGEFKQFCLEQASKRLAFWRDYGIFTANDIARMNEVQFVSDLTFNLLNGLSDFKPTELNKMYKTFDESFPHWGKVEKRLNYIFKTLYQIKKEAISDTIFSRQPLFFSLCLVVDEVRPKDPQKLQEALLRIDNIFNAEIPMSERSQQEAEFILASTRTTQRIKQRKVRHNFIKKFI